MMDSFRRSFKSHGSHRHSNSRTAFSDEQEEQPILLHDIDDHAAAAADRPHPGEVVVKVDDAGSTGVDNAARATAPGNNAGAKIWREASRDVWKEEEPGRYGSADGKRRGSGGGSRGEFSFNRKEVPTTTVPEIAEDPPSRLISSFIHRQRAAGEELAIDMDLEMEELKSLPPSTSASKELRVSFHPRPSRARRNSSSSSEDDDDNCGASAESDNRRSKASPNPTTKMDAGVAGPEVVRCTSNATFQRGYTLLRAKTRSRLMDPLPPAPMATPVSGEDGNRSGKIPKSGQLQSGILKSGFGGKSQRLDEDDEDPFMDEDVPDELKRSKFSWLTFVQWLGFVLILVALICSLSIARFRNVTVWKLHLWKWGLFILVLICGRLVSGWVIRLAVFLIERNFVLRKRVLYFVYGVRKAVQNCIWLGLGILSWLYLLDKKVQHEINNTNLRYVTKILFCLLVATVCWLIKTLLVKVLASSFHVSTYFDRIQEAVFNQYVIETLSGPPMIEIQAAQEEEDRVIAEMQKLQNMGVRIPNDLKAAALRTKSGTSPMQKSTQIGKSIRLSRAISKKEGGKQQDEGITIEKLSKLNQKNVSAWNMKRLMRVVRYGTLTTLDEQIPREYGEDESTMHIRSEYEAKTAAKKIFHNVAGTCTKYIYLTDLMRFMKEDDAVKTMSLFEGAQERNRVSRRALKNWVVNAFKDRKALSLTLNDTKTAVNKLHQMVNVVVGLIVFGIWLLILGIATTRFFVLLGSQLLLVVFVFGNTLKTVFEALIFLFVMHPFDVGDRCEIDGIQMFVEEMNIMTTIFLRYDNQKISYPNSVLATKPIGNYYRSPDMGESIDFCVHVATPVEKLAIMRDRIIGFMENKKEHWYPGPSVVLRDVDDLNRLKISIWMKHRINFQDMGMRWTRRQLVVEEMIKVLKELDIEYRMLPLDVNVRNMPTITSSRLPSTWTTFN